MYDNRIKWCVKKSKHFIIKFPKNSHIETAIDVIVDKRENAYNTISDFLKVKSDRLLTLYFSPSVEFCIANEMLVQASVPHQFFASLVYDEHPLSFEKCKYGHEIAHLLVQFWDRKMYHLEFLEEGLATILDMSGINYHLNYLEKVQYLFNRKLTDFSLEISYFSNNTSYEKAASFVKFLIDQNGIEKFKELYISSAIQQEQNGKIFKINGKKLPKDYLKLLIRSVYHKNSLTIQKEWLENIGIII